MTISERSAPEATLKLGRLKGLIKAKIKSYFISDYFTTKRQYFHKNGFYPNLFNPRDLSEKVSWLKLHDRSPLHTLCADKIRVRDYVAARAGADLLAPVLLVTRDPDDIRPEIVRAPRFVVKTNHDQGGVFICRDRDAFDWQGVRGEIRRRIGLNKYRDFREHQYKKIPRAILVEDFVEGEGGAWAPELKINCIHGEPKFVQVIFDRFECRRQVFYSPDWKRLPMRGQAEPFEGDWPRPPCLERALQAAAILSEPFLFCRVDFLYGAGGRPWFGEMTFHPAAGIVRYRPAEIERAFGDMIDLSRFAEARRLQRVVLRDIAPLRGQGRARPGK